MIVFDIFFRPRKAIGSGALKNKNIFIIFSVFALAAAVVCPGIMKISEVGNRQVPFIIILRLLGTEASILSLTILSKICDRKNIKMKYTADTLTPFIIIYNCINYFAFSISDIAAVKLICMILPYTYMAYIYSLVMISQGTRTRKAVTISIAYIICEIGFYILRMCLTAQK